MTIDIGIGTRLDDLAKVAFEIYYRGMTLASEIEKSSARIAKVKEAEIDPSLRTNSIICSLLTISPLFNCR